MKLNYRRLIVFLFIIVSIIFMFSSCAVSKYDYYYTSMALMSKDSSIEKYDHYCNYFSEGYQRQGNNKDSTYFTVEFDVKGKALYFDIKNYEPVYIDYAESRININNTSYKIEFPEHAKNKNDTILLSSMHYAEFYKRFGELSPIANRNIINLYDEYDEKEYVNYILNKNEVKLNMNSTYPCDLDSLEYEKLCKTTILCKEFIKDNSPLKINIEIVYYTDSLLQNRNTANFDFYQNRLLKVKNMKYNESRKKNDYRWGEKIGVGMNDITFYIKSKSGIILGWDEVRYGLGWAVTIPVLPIIFIIDFTAFCIAGDEYGNIPFSVPLFQ